MLLNFFHRVLRSQSLKMSCFTQILNPITGESNWELKCEDYDYHQEVARAGFADMLHDTERNQKYYAALRKTVKKFHEKGLKANVLDIGTGTGILSMMAVTCGADSVTACEAFLPMARCAEKILQANGMNDKINLIKKRSTEVLVGDGKDMPERANILVTEVFDTELIGEGAIDIFNHAHQNLLTQDCVVIPDSSTVYAQIVESPLVAAWFKPKTLANLDGVVLLKCPKSILDCQGDPAVLDVQLSQIPLDSFNAILDPFPLFDFDWSGKQPVPKNRFKDVQLVAKSHGVPQAVFLWWDLKMDQEGEIILSCAPFWVHPDYENLAKQSNSQKPKQNIIPWRDHWMQGIYFIPNSILLSNQQKFNLLANHDQYSFWFNVVGSTEMIAEPQRFSCSCGLHLAYSRTRVGQLNNSLRNKKYLRLLEDTIRNHSKVLSIGDGCLLGLSTAIMGAASVQCVEKHRLSREVLRLYVEENNLKNVTIYDSIEGVQDLEQITHIVAEPSFSSSILPWDNFHFGMQLGKIKEKLNKEVQIIPQSAIIYALPVEFLDLHRIRAPLEKCEGFDLSVFDQLIEESSQLADANVEAQPLWEYPCKALSKEQKMLSVNFSDFNERKATSGSIPIEFSGSCNGIAVWTDWSLDGSEKDKSVVTTGPTKAVEVGEFVTWDMYTRQGVQLITHPKMLTNDHSVRWEVNFTPDTGEIHFKFNFV